MVNTAMHLRNLDYKVHSYRRYQLVQEMFGHHYWIMQMSTNQSCLSKEVAFAVHREEMECLFASVIIIEASYADEAFIAFASEMAIIMPSMAVESSATEAVIVASFVTEESLVFASWVIPSSLAASITQEESMETSAIAGDKEVSMTSC